MKFSENWLRQHVRTDATREELTAKLTAIGLEVEGVVVLGESLDGVIVARIVECARHPEADRLQVCQVDAGQGRVLQIVCGAPNARPGVVAPLATIGAMVGDIAIQAAKLRGVASNGMLCSARELGLDADASGLLELPDDAPVGTPLADYLGLPDASIELKLTPNRADCFSVRGIAFDVAAACGSDVVPLDAVPMPALSDACLAVKLNAGAAAPRYVGRVIEGVDATRKTPIWMAERLRRSGIRPVSLLVDVTQYVMLELGQPMHAYDRDLLHGPIGVRRARAGEGRFRRHRRGDGIAQHRPFDVGHVAVGIDHLDAVRPVEVHSVLADVGIVAHFSIRPFEPSGRAARGRIAPRQAADGELNAGAHVGQHLLGRHLARL